MSKRFPALLFLLALGGSAVAPSVARADDAGVVSARPMRVHERRQARVQHRQMRRLHGRVARADVRVPPVCTSSVSVARGSTVVTSNSPFVPGREVTFRQVTRTNPASSCSMAPAPVATLQPPQAQPFPIHVTMYDSTSRFQPSRRAMPMPMPSASVGQTVQPMPSTSVYTEQQIRTPMPVDTSQDRGVRPGDRGVRDEDLVPAERVIVPSQDSEGVRPGDVGND
jgi:hypothetical protein